MKKHLYAFLFVSVALLGGCSKSEPEPEPAEQVIGIYDISQIFESVKFADSPREQSDATIYPYKANDAAGVVYNVTAVFEVSKTSSNIVNLIFYEKYTDPSGKVIKGSPDPISGIELKKTEGSAGQFDMLDTGEKIGSIGNGNVTLESIISDKDSTGRAYTYTIRVTGKKAQ